MREYRRFSEKHCRVQAALGDLTLERDRLKQLFERAPLGGSFNSVRFSDDL